MGGGGSLINLNSVNPSHFHSFSFIFIQFHSFSFIFIHFHSFSFIFIHFHSFSFIFIHFHSFSFIFIHFHSFSFIFIHSLYQLQKIKFPMKLVNTYTPLIMRFFYLGIESVKCSRMNLSLDWESQLPAQPTLVQTKGKAAVIKSSRIPDIHETFQFPVLSTLILSFFLATLPFSPSPFFFTFSLPSLIVSPKFT